MLGVLTLDKLESLHKYAVSMGYTDQVSYEEYMNGYFARREDDLMESVRYFNKYWDENKVEEQIANAKANGKFFVKLEYFDCDSVSDFEILGRVVLYELNKRIDNFCRVSFGLLDPFTGKPYVSVCWKEG